MGAASELLSSLSDQGAFFDVVEDDVASARTGKKFEGKKMICRADDGTPIGIVSRGYPTVTNRDIFEKFGAALDESSLDLTGATADLLLANGGARTMVTFRFPSHKIELGVGDVSELQIVCRNSYDGRWKFLVRGGALRLACMNGMLLGDWAAAYCEYHNQNLSVDHAAQKVVGILDTFRDTTSEWSRMKSAKISDETAWRVVCKYHGRDADFKRGIATCREATRETTATRIFNHYEVKEKPELGANAFAAYNALTHHATHARRREGKEAVSLSRRMDLVQAVLASRYWRERVVPEK